MELNEENLLNIKTIALKFDKIYDKLHPLTAAQMIKDGINPLEISLEPAEPVFRETPVRVDAEDLVNGDLSHPGTGEDVNDRGNRTGDGAHKVGAGEEGIPE